MVPFIIYYLTSKVNRPCGIIETPWIPVLKWSFCTVPFIIYMYMLYTSACVDEVAVNVGVLTKQQSLNSSCWTCISVNMFQILGWNPSLESLLYMYINPNTFLPPNLSHLIWNLGSPKIYPPSHIPWPPVTSPVTSSQALGSHSVHTYYGFGFITYSDLSNFPISQSSILWDSVVLD